MRERFLGQEGKRRLVDALADQDLVDKRRSLAEALQEVASINEYEKTSELYRQGDASKSKLFFILSGSFDLLVNDVTVAVVKAGEVLGEVPILYPDIPFYQVTARARELSVVALVPERKFREISKNYPEVWENMARMLGRRLLGTHSRILPTTRAQVVVGYGRSRLWKRVHSYLKNDLNLEVVAWGESGTDHDFRRITDRDRRSLWERIISGVRARRKTVRCDASTLRLLTIPVTE